MKKKVELKGVSKTFELYEKKSQKILNLFSLSKKPNKNFAALNDISFEVYDGETVGIIGLNGSGKSTVSNILGEVLQPTDGEVIINGKSSLIAISAGLNNNLSGRDNIELKCIMLGLNKKEIAEVTPDIIDFADLGDYINQPVKDYSSGMKSRLGFAISVHTDPDILIIDEALSVGDSTFTQKSLDKMNEFKERGKTIFFISHSASQMKQFCEKVVWVHYGKVKEIGDSEEVVDNYMQFTNWFNSLTDQEKKIYKREMFGGQVTFSKKSKAKERESSVFPEILKNVGVIIPVIVTGILMLIGY